VTTSRATWVARCRTTPPSSAARSPFSSGFWEKRGWDVSEVDRQFGEQAGIKNATFLIKGEYAFGYMRAEAGVHRLVRPSPFNAQGKRQTSFASVDVTPQFEEVEEDLEIPEGDLDIVGFVRASGPGGQNVNKVSSAVQLRFDAARSPSLPDDVRARLMALAIKLKRTVFMVFGVLGVYAYLGHLAWTVFQDSVLFPFVLALLGLSLILGTVFGQHYLRHRLKPTA
jgi:hypothetical protein